MTLLAKGWKSSAVPKQRFSNKGDEFNTGIKTMTRLQLAKPAPKDVAMIAVLADAASIHELPLKEVQDEALVGKIAQYIRTKNELNLEPDIQLLKTRLLRVSPTILLSETFLAPRDEEAAVWEKQLAAGCGVCENVPLLVGATLEDLFKEIRSTEINVERTCGGIELAFELSGRTYVVSGAQVCEGDSFSAVLVHDLSGNRAKLAYKLTGGL